mmetsp:Transcript_18356/g.36546  ORF Transcript_18356/g.36546 Transcript_18356/m.36546 type:complete len:82 (-) Transcript_18356:43-288(-)
MRREWNAVEVNIVVTTALILGRPAPVMITNEIVAAMKAGSITIDLPTEDKGFDLVLFGCGWSILRLRRRYGSGKKRGWRTY